MTSYSEVYSIVIAPLSPEDGGGYLGFAPDLQGCYSDGETQEEALRNTADAIEEWIDAYRTGNPERELPRPGSAARANAAEKEKMAGVIRQLSELSDQIDDRIDALAARIEEIQEQIESMEQWSRFVVLVGESPAVHTTLELTAQRAISRSKS